MRKLFLGAAAAIALAAPGVAAANGYVGLDYNNVDADGIGSEDSFGVSGSVVLTPNFALDAAVAENDDDTAWGATGHLFTNNSSYLFGGFLGFTGNDDTTSWGGGVEGQYYMNNVTWAGAVSYGTNDDSDVDAWGINGEGRYFVSENFRLEAGLGWFSVDGGGGADDDAISLGVGGEYQFSAAPISVGLGYTNTQFDEADLDIDTFQATVRYNFGGGSLMDRDRSGGGLAGLSGVGAALGL
ncbi:MAG: hypothetical protein NW206_19340 [Hyphomonadaceae bacterium]|nr:hypothetical protein [Hyphomonadaceae bacterium]